MFILSIARFAYAAGPSINLPPAGTVDATYYNPGPVSYWSITLSNVPSGYDVTNGYYVGWCCDETYVIYNGATLSGVTLYSSYDPSQPWEGGSAGWNKVNYIINHKQGTADDVQAAIWHYIDDGYMPTTQAGINMVNAADANPGFVPTSGQLLAVVVYLAGSQSTFIEVTVPTQYAQLTVTSAHDSPTPTSGSYAIGTGITASVTPIVAGPAGVQYVCTGWTGTGDVPATGTGTSVTFTINQDSSITWNWKTQYYLTVNTSPSGLGTIPGAGWYDQGQTVTLTAPISLGGYRLITNPFSWDVDGTPQGIAIPITVTMDSAHTATAHYVDLSVGGEWAPITLQTAIPMNMLQLMAPWIVMGLIAAATAVATYRRFIRKRW